MPPGARRYGTRSRSGPTWRSSRASDSTRSTSSRSRVDEPTAEAGMTDTARSNGRGRRVTRVLAELHIGEQSFKLDTPDERELTLGRHSEDGRYVPDVDLGDLPRGRTVSRRH